MKNVKLFLVSGLIIVHHVTLKELAFTKATNYPCPSIDLANCSRKADITFTSVKAGTVKVALLVRHHG